MAQRKQDVSNLIEQVRQQAREELIKELINNAKKYIKRYPREMSSIIEFVESHSKDYKG